MQFRSLLQIYGRLWLMEDSQAAVWASIAHRALVLQEAGATVPQYDPRTWFGGYVAKGDQRPGFYRVDSNMNMTAEGEVQIILVKGPMMQDDYCGALGTETIIRAIAATNSDQAIKSIVLIFDSPGGTVAGTHNFAKAVGASQKPILGWCAQAMCSAAYWGASACREIVANDEYAGAGLMIGNIGTKASLMLPPKEEDPTQPRIEHIYATKAIRKGAFSDELTGGNYDRLISELDLLNDIFHADVKKNRAGKLQLTKEDNVLEGDVYNGKEALKLGLIDKIGSLEYTVKRSLQLAKSIRA